MHAGLIAARLDRLPMSRTLWTRVLLLSLGGFFEFYDLLFTGYIAPGLVASGRGHGSARVHLRRRSGARLRARSRGPPRGGTRRLDSLGLRGRVGAARETPVPSATRGSSHEPVTTFDAWARNYRAPGAYKGIGRGSARLSTG